MKRFFVVLLLSIVLDATVSAAEPICGYGLDRSREQRSTVSSPPQRRSFEGPLVEPAVARISSTARLLPEKTQTGVIRQVKATDEGLTSDWRISTREASTGKSKSVALRWKGVEQVDPVATLPVRQTKPVAKMSFQERFTAKRRANARIRRAGYDLEELQDKFSRDLDRAKPVSSINGFDFTNPPATTEPRIEFERTYEVAAPPRPSEQKESPSDEVELVLEQLRRELRKEIEAAEREKKTRQERQSEQAVEINSESLIPRSAPPASNNPSSIPLDLGLSLEAEEGEDEIIVEEFIDDGEAPPMPDVPGTPSKNISTWNQSPWTLGDIAGQEVFDPCEPYYCQQMWECAGGRSASWAERAFRNLERNIFVSHGKHNEAGQTGSGFAANLSICRPAFDTCWNLGAKYRSRHPTAQHSLNDGSRGVLHEPDCTEPNCPECGHGTPAGTTANDATSGCTAGCTDSISLRKPR